MKNLFYALMLMLVIFGMVAVVYGNFFLAALFYAFPAGFTGGYALSELVDIPQED